MATIQAQLAPTSEPESYDFEADGRRIAGFTLDGVQVFIATHVPQEDKDAGIVSSTNLLIGVLVGLRDAAAQRIREEKAAHDAAWAAALNSTDDAPLADAGDHYIGMPA